MTDIQMLVLHRLAINYEYYAKEANRHTDEAGIKFYSDMAAAYDEIIALLTEKWSEECSDVHS